MLLAGVDLGGTNIVAALVDGDGAVLAREKVQTPPTGPAAVVEAIAGAVEALAAEGRGAPLAVGVGAPGAVRDGVVVAAPNLTGWVEPVPLGRLLSRRLGSDVVVDNDASVAAVGEWRWGAARGARFVLCITLGTGVGGGLVLDGAPYRGAHGAAGELGHMTVLLGGALCGCGRRGCVEAYAGRASMERSARVAIEAGEASALADVLAERGKRRMTASVWAEALDRRDPLATRLVDEAVTALGAGVAAVVNLLDLDTVVVAGGLAERLGDPLVERIAAATTPHVLDREAQRRFLAGALGDDAGILGAAAIASPRSGEVAGTRERAG